MEKHSDVGAVGVHIVSTQSFCPESQEIAVVNEHETHGITRHGFVLVPTPSDDPRDPLVKHFSEHYTERAANLVP